MSNSKSVGMFYEQTLLFLFQASTILHLFIMCFYFLTLLADTGVPYETEHLQVIIHKERH